MLWLVLERAWELGLVLSLAWELEQGLGWAREPVLAMVLAEVQVPPWFLVVEVEREWVPAEPLERVWAMEVVGRQAH